MNCLNDDAFQQIFTHMKPREILKMQLVHKNWFKVINNDQLWKYIHDKHFGSGNSLDVPYKNLVKNNIILLKNMLFTNIIDWLIMTKNNALFKDIFVKYCKKRTYAEINFIIIRSDRFWELETIRRTVGFSVELTELLYLAINHNNAEIIDYILKLDPELKQSLVKN